MKTKPELASIELEESMEDKQTPEQDRDEVRRFYGFLKRDRTKPLSDEMRAFVLGADGENPHD